MFCLCIFSSTFSIDGRSRSSRGLRWRSWTALGAYVGSLGRSWGLCWRSWAALRAYVGGLGSGSGPKLAVLGPKWSVLEAIRAKSGPNPSRKAIWQADQGGKVAQTRAGRPFWGGNGFTMFSGAGPRCPIFSVDISEPACLDKKQVNEYFNVSVKGIQMACFMLVFKVALAQ